MTEAKKSFPQFKVYAPREGGKQWFVYWYENGRRRKKYGDINRHAGYDDRMAAALALVEQLKAALQPPSPDLRDAVLTWLAGRRPFWKVKSGHTYASIAETFFNWLGWRRADADNVAAFFEWLAQGHSGTTYNNYRQKLGQMFSAVGEEGLLTGIGTVKETPMPARYFQPEQVARLKARISQGDAELWLFIQFVFYCFIRPGELRLMRVEDVLIAEHKIMVRSDVSKNRKTQYVAIPKPFLPALSQALAGRQPGEYIFPSVYDRSKPIGMNTMGNRHRKFLRELGFSPAYKLYSWKHTGAVMAVKAGVGVKELQMQLRHHSLDQVNEYLRQMGVMDMANLKDRFPTI